MSPPSGNCRSRSFASPPWLASVAQKLAQRRDRVCSQWELIDFGGKGGTRTLDPGIMSLPIGSR